MVWKGLDEEATRPIGRGGHSLPLLVDTLLVKHNPVPKTFFFCASRDRVSQECIPGPSLKVFL